MPEVGAQQKLVEEMDQTIQLVWVGWGDERVAGTQDPPIRHRRTNRRRDSSYPEMAGATHHRIGGRQIHPARDGAGRDVGALALEGGGLPTDGRTDRKSTRLNS